MKIKKCIICKKEFTANGTTQKYCGSIIQKVGCAYSKRLESQRNRMKLRPKPKSNPHYNVKFNMPKPRVAKIPQRHEFWFTQTPQLLVHKDA